MSQNKLAFLFIYSGKSLTCVLGFTLLSPVLGGAMC